MGFSELAFIYDPYSMKYVYLISAITACRQPLKPITCDGIVSTTPVDGAAEGKKSKLSWQLII
jgi:hypothetical protein